METKFKPGNPGKPKGAKNKVATEIREKFKELLEAVTVEQMANDLQQLKPAERLNILMGLAEYITPKLARTQNNITSNGEPFNLKDLITFKD